MRTKHLICCTAAVTFLLIILRIWCTTSSAVPAKIVTPPFLRKKEMLSLNYHKNSDQLGSIFIYRAYYDDRAMKNTIRIFAISKCLGRKAKIEIAINGTISSLTAYPIEGKCPWTWAKGCAWNAYELRSDPVDTAPDEVTLSIGVNRKIVVKVERRPPVSRAQLQVCVPPLYWYHDWPRLVLFFELWRKHSPRFIFYVNSLTKNSQKVIDFYAREGSEVQLINWPLLPKAADGEDPNTSIYRLSHVLAHNDCVLRMEAEYGVLLDVDEYIHINNNRTLLVFAQQRFKNDASLGSLLFNHTGLKIDALNGTFEGISTSRIFENTRPSKTLFKSSAVQFLSTHWVANHSSPSLREEEVPKTDGSLLHYRTNFERQSPNETKQPPFDLDDLQLRCLETTKTVFGDVVPPFNSTISEIMEDCNGRWVSRGCKVPLMHCKTELEKADDWIFKGPSNDSSFMVL